jgi:hypothetical protein
MSSTGRRPRAEERAASGETDAPAAATAAAAEGPREGDMALGPSPDAISGGDCDGCSSGDCCGEEEPRREGADAPSPLSPFDS